MPFGVHISLLETSGLLCAPTFKIFFYSQQLWNLEFNLYTKVSFYWKFVENRNFLKKLSHIGPVSKGYLLSSFTLRDPFSSLLAD